MIFFKENKENSEIGTNPNIRYVKNAVKNSFVWLSMENVRESRFL